MHLLADLVLQAPAPPGGTPAPPGLFGDASQMPGFSKVVTVVHWAGYVILAACVVGIGMFGAQLVLSHRDPSRHGGQHGQSAGMIMAGLTILGSVGAIVAFFTSP